MARGFKNFVYFRTAAYLRAGSNSSFRLLTKSNYPHKTAEKLKIALNDLARAERHLALFPALYVISPRKHDDGSPSASPTTIRSSRI
jgi:hypothetical protein